MKKILILVALVAGSVFATAAMAADPITTPFPAPKTGDVFVAGATATADGSVNDYFAPGGTVVFRAYAVDAKTHQLLKAKDVRYFYVTIPNQPNVKLKFDAAAKGRYAWTGTWTVPSSYPLGLVPFRVLVKTTAKKVGQFVQMPVTSSMLTISATAPTVPGPGPLASQDAAGKLEVPLYVDSVNGTRPAAAKPRPIGCTQTNVYKRGEQFVLRSWGTDITTNEILSTDNVKEAHFSIAGQPDTTLNWGAHGNTGAKVWFWTNAWQIPADYPLGNATAHVVFTLENGKVGTYDYSIVINP
jgi:hypothetical protein